MLLTAKESSRGKRW